MHSLLWHQKLLFQSADVRNIAQRGNLLGIQLLRREINHEVEFSTIMMFESLDAVRELAGEDYETAVVPENARKLLPYFDGRSQHYEVGNEKYVSIHPEALERRQIRIRSMRAQPK